MPLWTAVTCPHATTRTISPNERCICDENDVKKVDVSGRFFYCSSPAACASPAQQRLTVWPFAGLHDPTQYASVCTCPSHQFKMVWRYTPKEIFALQCQARPVNTPACGNSVSTCSTVPCTCQGNSVPAQTWSSTGPTITLGQYAYEPGCFYCKSTTSTVAGTTTSATTAPDPGSFTKVGQGFCRESNCDTCAATSPGKIYCVKTLADCEALCKYTHSCKGISYASNPIKDYTKEQCQSMGQQRYICFFFRAQPVHYTW